jgi:putative ATP-binding cassette transporter
MKFMRLLFDQAGDGRTRLFLITLVPGIIMAFIIALVTTVSDYDRSQSVQFLLLGLFVLGCITVVITMVHSLNAMTVIVANFLNRTRLNITEQIRALTLTSYEKIGSARIHAIIGRDLQTIEEAAPVAVALIYFVMQLIASAIYVAYLSLLAFFVTIVLLVAAAYFYWRSYKDAERLWKAATDSEMGFRESLEHLLDGFKEVKLNAGRSEDLFRNHIVVRSGDVEKLRVQSGKGFNRGQSISDIFFYALMGAMVFAVPYYISNASIPAKIITVIVFASGAIAGIVRMLPMVAKANLAVESLTELEGDLAEAGKITEHPLLSSDAATLVAGLKTRALTYAYLDADGRRAFSVGPCDFEIKSGEIVFIVGGNGSGKSTFIKMLTRLYQPDSGTILWDGASVSEANAAKYRSLFTVIFSDFHLFDRLYGMDRIDTTTIGGLLAEMGLADKVGFQGNRFSTTNLSTGERKRLAMVVARLEARPICIFDEWAADQDPQFRRYYYETLLPHLKREGRTVIAVSHDDRYFHVADKVIWMEEGRIVHSKMPP